MVIGIALGFWEVLFYDLEKVGNIYGEQHRAKAGSLASCFFSERVPLICTC